MTQRRLFLYIQNDSYPELREVHSRWRRHQIWWRTFLALPRTAGFWKFVAVQVLVVACGLLPMRFLPLDANVARILAMGALIFAVCWLNLTLGGDVARPIFRRLAPETRSACPQCGHLFEASILQTADPAAAVRCAECGHDIPVSVFHPPYRIPRRFLAFPGWRRV